jgi:hypothetical protein
MFDRYMICEETVRNVRDGQAVAGFEFGARLPYYRGLGLSMVEEVAVTVDGKPVPRADVRVTVGGHTYALEQFAGEFEARWEMGEVATVRVAGPGGLPAGTHKLELMIQMRVSYLPFPSQGRDSKSITIAA